MHDLRQRAEMILRADIAPGLGLDPADLEVLDVENGIARVRFAAGCAGCGLSVGVLATMIEQEIRQKLPEIEIIEPAL
jgi:Fe-S cluster biogenesis protein NfuA